MYEDPLTEEEKKMAMLSIQSINEEENKPEYDEVNHPQRYTGQCSIECIDVMELTFGTQAVINFCMCNAFKYLWRYKAKNGEEDIRKAEWYLDHTVKLLDSDCRLRDKFFEQYDNLCKLYDKTIEKEAK